MHTKHNLYDRMGALPRIFVSHEFLQRVPETKDIPSLEFPIDETALAANSATLEQMQTDSQQLQTMAKKLESDKTTAAETLRKARVSFELGETTADAVKKAQDRYDALANELSKLTAQANEVQGQIEVKNAAIDVLKQRRNDAIELKRQQVYQDVSSEIGSKLAQLLRLYREANALEMRIIIRFRQLYKAKLIPEYVREADALDHEAMCKFLFSQYEPTLHYAKHNAPAPPEEHLNAPVVDETEHTESAMLFEK